jgi:hypothetical protein
MSICQCSDFDCVPKSSAWNTVVSETVIDVGAIKISPRNIAKFLSPNPCWAPAGPPQPPIWWQPYRGSDLLARQS